MKMKLMQLTTRLSTDGLDTTPRAGAGSKASISGRLWLHYRLVAWSPTIMNIYVLLKTYNNNTMMNISRTVTNSQIRSFFSFPTISVATIEGSDISEKSHKTKNKNYH